MLCHWRYVIDNLFGEVKSSPALGATHVDERIDEQGKPYTCTADDSAYATFELDDGVICCNSTRHGACASAATTFLPLQVDGTKGSAVAGLRDCAQHTAVTPRCTWNPDIDSPIDFYDGWDQVPDHQPLTTPSRSSGNSSCGTSCSTSPFRWALLEGAKGVQLAELGLESWGKRAWLDVPVLPE